MFSRGNYCNLSYFCIIIGLLVWLNNNDLSLLAGLFLPVGPSEAELSVSMTIYLRLSFQLL